MSFQARIQALVSTRRRQWPSIETWEERKRQMAQRLSPDATWVEWMKLMAGDSCEVCGRPCRRPYESTEHLLRRLDHDWLQELIAPYCDLPSRLVLHRPHLWKHRIHVIRFNPYPPDYATEPPFCICEACSRPLPLNSYQREA